MSYEDAPPAYDAAVSSAGPRANARAGGGSTSGADTRHNNASVASQGERVTGVANERQINSSERDITDEQRLLPPGWIVQHDEESEHFFFVDTAAHPPRSIWTHPLDDPDFLKSVPSNISPETYVHKLWDEVPDSDSPAETAAQQNVAQPQSASSSNVQSARTAEMGKQKFTSVKQLADYLQSKMGTPEEYERKNPPGKVSKLFHDKESPAERQRRHAEHRAQNMADELSYRRPTVAYGGMGGYPAYGRMGGGGGYYRPGGMYGSGMYGYGGGLGMNRGFYPGGLAMGGLGGLGGGLLMGSMLGGGMGYGGMGMGGMGGGFGGDCGGGGGDGGGGC